MKSLASPGAPLALWLLQLAIFFSGSPSTSLAQSPPRPILLSDLQDVTVDAGQRVALRVTLQSSTNRLYFQWSKDGDFLPQSVNGPELIITNAFSRHAGQYQVQILIPDVFPTPTTNSRVATVTVLSPTGLRITRQPEDSRARVNDPLTFSVEAQSSRPLRYQWFFNGSPISLETQSSLTVGTHVGFFGGGYSVIVSDGLDEVESRRALGTVQSFPIITQQPQSTRVRRGSTVTFSVAAIGKGPITYRWQSTVPLPPGTVTNGPTLTLSGVTQAHAGGYWVILKDADGQGSSNSAELAILPEISFTLPSYQAALAAGTNASFPSLPSTGPALSVALLKPNGGAVGPDGNIVFANTGTHVIKKLTPDQQVLDVAGSGIAGYLDGPALTSRFQDPLGACVDARGGVYVADSGNHRIRRVAPDGTVSTLAGSGVAGGAEGTGTAAQFNYPNDLALAPDGAVLVSEFFGHRIRRITTNGVVTTLVGTGTAGRRDGPRDSALLDRPGGVATDLAGNVYFTEWGSHSIRRLGTNGIVTTLAGTGEAGYIDGPAATAQLHNPDGIVVAPSGEVFFTDRENHAVRRLSTAGLVETVIGDGISGSDLGSVATARMNLPSGLALTGDGSLVVADTENRRLLLVTPESGTPVLLTQPQDTVGSLGRSLTLQVDASGVGPLTFQWFKDGQALPAGTNTVLLLSPLSLADSGLYSIAVRDRRGETRSRKARVTVVASDGPTLRTQPQSVAVLPGATAVFSVDATGTGPLEYQWRRDDRLYDLPGERGPTLTLTNAGWDLVGTYSVLVRDAVGPVRSETATLSLLPTPRPVILSGPTHVFLRRGTWTQLRVEAQGTGPLEYIWSQQLPTTIPFHEIHRSHEPFYNTPVYEYPPGIFRVSVMDRALQAKELEFTITLVPAAGPYVTVQPPRSLSVKWGEPARLRIAAEGSRNILYQWYHDGRPLPESDGPELVVPRVTTATQGSYTVKVSDGLGNTFTSEPCFISFEAPGVPTFMVSPSNVVAALGTPATFSSEAIYLVPLQHQWFRNGIPIPGAIGASLHLPAVTESDPGEYWVVAGTSFASVTSQVARLDLPPLIHASPRSHTVSTAAGQPLPGDAFGPGPQAAFNSPAGLAVGPSGRLFIADTANHRIKELSPEGEVQLTAGQGLAGSADDPARTALFRRPTGLAFLPATGDLRVADTGNHLLRSLTASGLVETLAGQLGRSNILDGPVASAQIPRPARLAPGPDGALYFTSAGGKSVRRLTAAGVIETYAGSTNAGFLDGPRLTARFQGLGGLAFDRDGHLWVAESDGHRIRRISPDGQVTTLAGSPQSEPGYTDDTGTHARFRFPQGITFDAAGHLIVADTGNHALRLVSPDGVVTTLAGTGSPGDTDGPAIAATFHSPADVAVMPDGTVFVADTANHRIRRVTLTEPLRLTFQGTGANLTLSWPSGILQTAPTALGPWDDAPAATSPQTLPVTQQQRFFRIRSP